MTKRSETLHEALAAFNIRSFPGTIPGKRRLVQFGEYEIGEFDAHEGWALVNQLRFDDFESGNALYAASFAA